MFVLSLTLMLGRVSWEYNSVIMGVEDVNIIDGVGKRFTCFDRVCSP